MPDGFARTYVANMLLHMTYGPRTAEVRDFLFTLIMLQQSEWNASYTRFARSLNVDKRGDDARLWIALTTRNNGLLGFVKQAKSDTRTALLHVPWSSTALERSAEDTVSAIVVMDFVPNFRDIVFAFGPFLDTAVALPVER